MYRSQVALVIMALAAVTAVSAQPFTFTPGAFEPDLQEAVQRKQSNFTGFVFNFENATKTDGGTPNGSLKSNQVSQNPFLSTLPGTGNGQTLITMGPCASNTPHIHPRGSEIAYMIEGEIEFGMVEENGGDNALHVRRIKKGETIHIPQGVIHFSYNPHCFASQFIANFPDRDPGLQTVWASLMKIPNSVLMAATGIPESTFTEFKKMPQLITPATGGDRCLKRCNITFEEANAFLPAPGVGPNI